MKLIATLATLAALVGQTEAATSAITTTAVTLGNGVCEDKLMIGLTVTALAAGDTLEVQLDGITTDKTTLAETTTMADWTGESGEVTADPLITKDGTKTTWKFTLAATATGVDGIAAGTLQLSLINLCAPNIHDFDGVAIKLKTKMTAAAEASPSDSDFKDASASTNLGTTKLADFKINKMPTAKDTEGEFEAEFTGVVLASQMVTINLPTGYIVPEGAVCKIGPADGTLNDVTPSGGLAAGAGTTNSQTFTVAAAITAVKTKFTCDKVKSGTTWTYDATKNVAIKLGSATVPAYAGYATMSTAAPTAKPTAKAADSPASVATASGVVVGALGVAALFLA